MSSRTEDATPAAAFATTDSLKTLAHEYAGHPLLGPLAVAMLGLAQRIDTLQINPPLAEQGLAQVPEVHHQLPQLPVAREEPAGHAGAWPAGAWMRKPEGKIHFMKEAAGIRSPVSICGAAQIQGMTLAETPAETDKCSKCQRKVDALRDHGA